MKTVIVYKWARNIEDAAVRNDGSIDWRNAKMTPGEDDFAALDAAKAVAGDDELVGLTIGDGDASWALARGVAATTSITDAPKLADNLATAQILAAGVRKIGGVEMVLIGDAEGYGGVPVALAGLLGWPVLTGVETAELVNGRVQVRRKLGAKIETISLSSPAVIAVSATSPEKNIPGMKEQLMARKRPVTKLTMADVEADAAEKASVQASRLPEVSAASLFDGEPEAAAAQLVSALREEGVL